MKASERLLFIILLLTIVLWAIPSVIYWIITGRTGILISELNKLSNKAVD